VKREKKKGKGESESVFPLGEKNGRQTTVICSYERNRAGAKRAKDKVSFGRNGPANYSTNNGGGGGVNDST